MTEQQPTEPDLRFVIDPPADADEQDALIAAITVLLAEQRFVPKQAPALPAISRWARAGRAAAHHRKDPRRSNRF